MYDIIYKSRHDFRLGVYLSTTPRTIKKAIIFVQRPPLRALMRDELNKLSVKSVTNAADEVDCRRQLLMFPQALLVFDWDWGAKVAGRILQAASTEMHQEPRPLYIVAMQSTFDIVAIGLEYRAARVHLGEASPGSVSEHLRDILDMYAGKKDVDAAFLEIYAARERNDWKAAEKAVREILTYHPNHERATIEQTINFIGQGQWQKALATIKTLAEEDDMNLRAQGLYARCLMGLQRHSEAVVVLEKARMVHPNHVDRLIDLGKSLFHIDKVQDAYQQFQQAHEIDEGSKPAIFGMSACKLVQGDINASLDLMRNVSTPEELASVFNNAAILSIRHGRFENGFNLYRAALGALKGAKEPVLAKIIFNMGLAYYRTKNLPKAKDLFEKALTLDQTFDKAKHNVKVIESMLRIPVSQLERADFLEVQLMQDFEDEKF